MKIKAYLSLIVIVALFPSCEEYMDITFDKDSIFRLVVEGGITTDTTTHAIALSSVGDFFNKEPRKGVSGATVTLTDGTQLVSLTELVNGIYLTPASFYGLPGRSYTLEINLGDTIRYEATEKLRGLPEIDSITFTPDRRFANGLLTTGYVVNYHGPEPAGLGDCYLWTLDIDGKLYTDSIHKLVFVEDEFVDGSYINVDLFFIPDSDIKEEGVEVTLVMYSISKAYYDFLVGLFLETVWKGSPWDGPPANAKGNITGNEAIGYFTASDKRSITRHLTPLVDEP